MCALTLEPSLVCQCAERGMIIFSNKAQMLKKCDRTTFYKEAAGPVTCSL